MKEEIIIEMDSLRKVIEYVFDVDILLKVRKRQYVNARMVFSKILSDNGYGITNIGRYLKKDHSSIIHYMDVIKTVLKFDEVLMGKYMYAKDMYVNKMSVPYHELNPVKLTSKEKAQQIKIQMLNDEIDSLILEKRKLMIISKTNNRLSEIINFIDKQTPHGQEAYLLRKISTMFNGLKFYG